MLFEAHVTVEGENVSRWQEFCHERSVKPVLIQLSRGKFPTQLMCTAMHHGNEVSADDMVGQLMFDAKQAGFNCLRAKLERPLYDVSDPDAEYAECHIKLLLNAEQSSVVHRVEEPGIFLSESLLGVTPPVRKWYLTARTDANDVNITQGYFDEVLDRVKSRAPVVRMESEAVVYDTNPDLDSGWAH